MTKKILVFLFLTVVFAPSTFAQHTLSDNMPYYDTDRFHWGFYGAFSLNDFKITPNTKGMTDDGALGIKTKDFYGVSLGLVSDFKLNDYFNFLFEPGLNITQKTLEYNKDIILDSYIEPTIITKHNAVDSDTIANIIKIKSTAMNIPILLKFGGKRRHNFRPYIIGGLNLAIYLSPKKNRVINEEDVPIKGFEIKTFNYSWQAGAGIDLYRKYHKFSMEIRGSFGINNELVKDQKVTPWTAPIDKLQTRAVFFVLKFE